MLETGMNHGNDTDTQIFFYDREFYVFSNFSAFQIEWKGKLYPTSEHVFHSEKFESDDLKESVRLARSAHDALKFAEAHDHVRRSDWEGIELQVMKEILLAKVAQHSYVLKKLRDSTDRELIEDSWRDAFWGWGENRDGANNLGKLWMEVRAEILGQ